jgi:hypothetical protein
MRARQPHVQRHEARLGAEAEEREHEHGVANGRRQAGGRRAQVGEGRGGGGARQQQEGGEHQRDAAMGHGDVPASCAHRLRLARLGHHEEVGGE